MKDYYKGIEPIGDQRRKVPEDNFLLRPIFRLMDLVFHTGWKTTFAFSVLIALTFYLAWIRYSGMSHKYSVTFVVFVLAYWFFGRYSFGRLK